MDGYMDRTVKTKDGREYMCTDLDLDVSFPSNTPFAGYLYSLWGSASNGAEAVHANCIYKCVVSLMFNELLGDSEWTVAAPGLGSN